MQTRLDFSLEKHNYHVYVIWQRLNYWRPQNIFFRFLEGSLSRPIYGVVKPQYGENYASEVNINFPGWCPRGGGRNSHIKRMGYSSYLLGVKKIPVLVSARVLNLKRTTAGAFAVTFRVLSWKNMTGDNVLCKNWYLFGEKKIWSHTYNCRILVPLRDSFQNFWQTPPPILYGSYPQGCLTSVYLLQGDQE